MTFDGRNGTKSSISAGKKKKNTVQTSRNPVKFTGIKIDKQLTTVIDSGSTLTLDQNGTHQTFRVKGGEKINRRGSFSLTHTTYKDARGLWHPLKDTKTPILNDLETIEKMKKANRYPVPEKLLHKPENF